VIRKGKGQSFRAEAVSDQFAKCLFVNAVWELLQSLHQSNIEEHFMDRRDAEREIVSLDVVRNGIKSCFQLRGRPTKLAGIPEEEFVPVVYNGGREEFLPLEVRIPLALAFRRAASGLKAGVTSPIMHQVKEVFGVVVGQG
jgi:hypothetical protein